MSLGSPSPLPNVTQVTPGNVLRLDNKRKMLCVYVTIKELGPRFLKDEFMWLPVAVIRSTRMKTIPGGASACFRILFQRWFEVDKISEGFTLDLGVPGTRHATFFLRLGNVVADGDAYRAIWSAKGASGKLPCLVCRNVLSERVASDYLVHISCPDPDRLDPASNEDIWEKADFLSESRGILSKPAFDRQQMVAGLTYNEDGLLWCQGLRQHVRPVDCITFDAMHVTVSNGIAQNETALLLSAMSTVGIKWQSLRAFAEADWHFCSALGRAAVLRDCFARPREDIFKRDGSFRATASEMLLSVPVVLHFLDKIVRPRGLLLEEAESYMLLGRMLELLRRGKDGGNVHEHLATATKAHAEQFARAYPDAEVKPKNHYALHLPKQLERHGLILDAFVGERKNGMLKNIANDVKNTVAFERTVISRAICKQLDHLDDPDCFRDRLVGAVDEPVLAALHRVAEARVASAAVWRGMRVAIDDIMAVDGCLYQVAACCSLEARVGFLVYTFEMRCRVSATAARWSRSAEFSFLALDSKQVRLADGWYLEPDGSVVVLSSVV